MCPSLLIGLALSVGAPGPKDRPKKDAPIVGEWAAETVLHNGQPDPAKPGALRYTFTADGGWVVARDDEKLGGSNRGYALGPKAEPPAVDFTLDRARPDAARLLGIYRVEGDTLTLCLAMPGKPRPTAFESTAGSDLSLIVFKRAKKD